MLTARLARTCRDLRLPMLLGVVRDFGEVRQRRLYRIVGIRRILELAAQIAVVGSHVEMSVPGEVEENRLSLARSLARVGLVDCRTDRVVGLRGGDAALRTGVNPSGLEGAALRHGNPLH